MSRGGRIALWIGGSLVAIILVLAAAALLIARTDWFRDMVRRRIVAEVENATGGQVEIRSFAFDWKTLRAWVQDFTIHGTEPPEAPPLFHARMIEVGLKIVSVLKKDVDIRSLIVQEPQAYVMAFPGGKTNIPEPKIKRQSDRTAMETLIDLAIGRFQLDNGTLQFVDRKMPLNARGERLRALLSYDLVRKRYAGDISISPLRLDWGKPEPVPVNVNTTIALETDRVEISQARLETPQSRVQLFGVVENLQQPRGSLTTTAELAVQELARYTGAAPPRNPSSLQANLSVRLENNRLDISGAQLQLGPSRLEASGGIRDLKTLEGSIQFDGRMALADLARRFDLSGVSEGQLALKGESTFRGAESYRVRADVRGTGLTVGQGKNRVSNANAVAAVLVVPDRIEANGLRVSALGGNFSGRAAIEKLADLRLEGNLRNFGLQELTRAYGTQDVIWSGQISGPVRVRGNLKGSGASAWSANARLGITPGSSGVPLAGRINVDYEGRRDLLDLDSSYIATPSTRLDFAGTLERQIHVRLASRDFRDFLPVLRMVSTDAPKELPIALENGVASFDGTVVGKIDNPRIQGRVAVTNFVYQKQKFDRLAAGADLTKSRAAVQNAVLSQGQMQARADGSVALQEWKTRPASAISANARISGADLSRLLALADQKDVRVAGTLDASAQVSGTVGQPQATGDLAVVKGSAYDEPFDRLQAAVTYSNDIVQLKSATLTLPAGRVDASGTYDPAGPVQFHVASKGIALDRLKTVQARRPGLTGTLNLAADGAGTVRKAPATPQFLLSRLEADVIAQSLEIDRKRVGTLRATANTRGSEVVFRLDSDFAGSAIRGNGTWRLTGNYPIDAQVTFSPVRLSVLRDWAAQSSATQQSDFDGVMEGGASISGPVTRPQELKASLRLTKLELGTRDEVLLRNPEPIVASLDRSVVRIQSARLTGKGTDITATGAVLLQQDNTLDLRVNGNAGLDILETFNRELYASGGVVLNAVIKGKAAEPVIDGRLELKDAAVNMASFPNGISKANGLVLFNKNRAVVRNLTATSGGGKLAVTGEVGYAGGEMDFRLQAKADEVRVRYPEGASTVASAALSFNGTTERSLLAGTVTILQTSFNPRTDLGDTLAQGAKPPPPEKARTGVLGGMQLDIRIESAPDVQFQTSLAQGIQLDADLRLQDSPSRPTLLGRLNISEGQVVFFGSQYTINRGTVAFYNPQQIEPVIDIELETKARGIDVVLNVSGEMGKLKVTHHSDPPLQFSEVVSLLATGKAPTSDPTLAARQSPEPQQSWQQMGASALLGQAVANPVSGRLQRLFGVSKLKIDPQITGAENTPQARLSLEQQITKELTFTYITDLTQSNPQIIRMEWSINRTWAATAVREQNGQFGLDFFYKRRFK